MVNEVKSTSSKALALVCEMLKVSIRVYECPRKGNPGLSAEGRQNERIRICKRALHKNSGSADQSSEVVQLNIIYKRFVPKRKPEQGK